MIGRGGRDRRSRSAVALLVVLIGSLVAACGMAPILANKPAAQVQPPPTPVSSPTVADPRPVRFPADDGPHDRLTEWWYYTGHLRDPAGSRYGFEYVIFRAERGALALSWAAHLAITDEAGKRFLYAQRSEIGPQVDRSGEAASGSAAFAFALTGFDPTASSGRLSANEEPWNMAGGGGSDTLRANAVAGDIGGAAAGGPFGLDLRLVSEKPPALQHGIGWIDFGPGGSSYSYSRTRMSATGSLELDGRRLPVEGTGWFDHQWGDFIAVGGGGWDWFAVELADGTDLMLSLVRSVQGSYPLVYGTLVRADGTVGHLDRAAFSVEVSDHWTSERTGARYPAGWTIHVPGEQLAIELRPTVADQELDTRPTSGVVYWEGSQQVTATRAGRRLGGEAYVELTGYWGSK